MSKQPNYEAYFEHAINLTSFEEEIRQEVMPEIPENIIDSHTHCSSPEFIDNFEMSPRILGHMMSTFPKVNVEQSKQIDNMFFPGKSVNKLRFAHIYPGMNHKGVTEYILRHSLEGDKTALFGLSDSDEDKEYTIAELQSGKYAALKMYYMSSEPPKDKIFDYFPPAILEVAQRENVPIILHLPHSLYRSEDEVDLLMQVYPDLKVVLAHIGVANSPKPELEAILRSFSKHHNLYVDTALVDSDDIVLAAFKNLGARKILYGSDEPLNLMRVVTFFNPDLQTARVLTDYPYHWANKEEQLKWRHLADKPFIHNQWHQIRAIIAAARKTSSSPGEYQSTMENVFSNNAQDVYGFR